MQTYGGGKAAAACEQMGAQAYASGNSLAFKGAPDLHTAAHEAAHIVQQRAGVSLSGGVDKSGDTYEKHADQVADAVVQGKSAEGLLDKHAGGGGGAAVQQQAIQMKGGLGKHLKAGLIGAGALMPGGEVFERMEDKVDRGTKTKDKVKIWALRAGSIVGQLFGPLAMLGGAFLNGAIGSYRRGKKKKKQEKNRKRDEQQLGFNAPHVKQDMAERLVTVVTTGALYKLCVEGKLNSDKVASMLLLKLGLPGGKDPGFDEGELLRYNELEKVIFETSQVMRGLRDKYLPQEDTGEEIDLDDQPTMTSKTNTNDD